jgi:predicted metal-dependent enzyme (double-stranded beta helix superfamily)
VCGLNVIHSSPEITIINVVWAPNMTFMPHNHLTWAVIGLYAGREDNVFWRRTPGAIEAFGAKALFAGDVAVFPVDVIHSVTNPLPRFSAGIHIYGGDFLNMERRQWNPETLAEESNTSSISHAILAAAGGARDGAQQRED